MLNLESISENEHSNVISCYWQMLKTLEMEAQNSNDTLLKHDVEAYYRLWNRMTGDTKTPFWIN